MEKNKLIDYFNGSLTPEEEALVQIWIAANPDDSGLEEVMRELYGASEAVDGPVLDKILSSIPYREEKTKRFPNAARIAFAAAAAIILLVAPLAFHIGKGYGTEKAGDVAWQELVVPPMENATLALADGTVLNVKSGTRVTYPESFIGRERTIFVDGEVYARVARDEEKPFIIKSSDTRVKVLGTSFNFRSFRDGYSSEVLLVEGSVMVSIDSETGERNVLMSPGNLLRYDRLTGEAELGDFPVSGDDTFRDDGAFHFLNIPLKDIADALSRHFGRRVVVLDEELARSRFFAIFTNGESLEDILESLNMNSKMSVNYAGEAVYISKKPKR